MIGIAGGREKCDFVKSLGADSVIDYKNENVAKRIEELASDGIDIYFDNVGGETLTAALDNLAMYSRIVLCGSISEYMLDEPFGPINYTNLRSTNSSMNGFFVYNHEVDFPEAEEKIANWIKEDLIKVKEDITIGFENMPLGLQNLYAGKNKGVALCKILDDSELIFD